MFGMHRINVIAYFYPKHVDIIYLAFRGAEVCQHISQEYFIRFRSLMPFILQDRKVTITGEGLQILTYAWHLLPLSSEGSLACHTYCDTGHPFIMVMVIM